MTMLLARLRRIVARGYGPAASLAFISVILWVDVALGMVFFWSFAAATGLVSLVLFLAEVTKPGGLGHG